MKYSQEIMRYSQEINGTDLDVRKNRQGQLQERNLLMEIFKNAMRKSGAQNGDRIILTRNRRFNNFDFKSSLCSLHNDKTHAEKIAAKATIIVEMTDLGDNKFEVFVTAEVKGETLERNLGFCSVEVIPVSALEDELVQAQSKAPARQARPAPSLLAQGLLGRKNANNEQARIGSTRSASNDVDQESSESKDGITHSSGSGITMKA